MRTMHAKQPDLRSHSSEVADLAVAVARRMGMDGEEIDEIARAAELHDVGKVGIPDAILDKPAGLDATEWELMHQHTILGERILNAAPALRPVARIVRSTHEHWDGAGYPDGLRGAEIPLAARIVAVCDAYDAMTTERAYSPAVGHEAACQELRDMAGSQFDPQVVEVFIAEVAMRSPAAVLDADEVGAPLQLVADRVRTLLGSAKLDACHPSPAASTGGGETTPTPPHPTRPVPDPRLPGPLGRARRPTRRWTSGASPSTAPSTSPSRGPGTSCARCPPRPSRSTSTA